MLRWCCWWGSWRWVGWRWVCRHCRGYVPCPLPQPILSCLVCLFFQIKQGMWWGHRSCPWLSPLVLDPSWWRWWRLCWCWDLACPVQGVQSHFHRNGSTWLVSWGWQWDVYIQVACRLLLWLNFTEPCHQEAPHWHLLERQHCEFCCGLGWVWSVVEDEEDQYRW